MKKGQRLYSRAKSVIPGGGMLLSKRPEMFLPGTWPSYFKKTEGCNVWDLDGNEFIDVSIMGIGTNTLGYSHSEVDSAVVQALKLGNMSSLQCPEEVYLAERLVDLHPWSGMVRFARTGGEVNSIAVRIARAASGKNNVAVCGYHGWHDWYLASNLGDKESLDGHLLPGLDPVGVPRNLQGSTIPFKYNNFEELAKLVNENNVGVIKMEVQRSEPPKDGYLEQVRDLATRKGIVLIFDECTSGFRETYGGLHKKYDIEPDMAIFGKALGNGYAVTAVIGRPEIMEAAQTTFISSTFWTERIGSVAGLATIKVMGEIESWNIITNTGLGIKKRWQEIADKHGVKIQQWGIPALAGFTILSERALAYKTLITQELLKKGYLASNTIYVSTEHTDEVLDGYYFHLENVFGLIKECEMGRDVMSLLDGPICHGGFKRLN